MATGTDLDEQDTVLSAVEERLRPTLFDGDTWVADYRRLRFVAGR